MTTGQDNALNVFRRKTIKRTMTVECSTPTPISRRSLRAVRTIARNKVTTLSARNRAMTDRRAATIRAIAVSRPNPRASSHLNAVTAAGLHKGDTTAVRKAAKGVRLDVILRTRPVNHSRLKGNPDRAVTTTVRRKGDLVNALNRDTHNARSTATIARHAAIKRIKSNRSTTTPTSTVVDVAATPRIKRAPTHRVLVVSGLRNERAMTHNVLRAVNIARTTIAHRSAVTDHKREPAAVTRTKVGAIPVNAVTVRKVETPANDQAVTPANVVQPGIAVMIKVAINPAHRAVEADLPLVLLVRQRPTAEKS